MPHEHEILDIAEAAAFLRVSETSLRRWTNAGLLRCYRIGGRRERRFLRSDLVAFLEPAAPEAATAHGHVCSLYTSEGMRTRVAGAFLAGGLALGSACFLAGTPAAQHATLAWIDRHRPGALDGPGAGPLFLGAYGDDPEGQLDDWRRWLEWTRDAGHRRQRGVGDVSAAPFAGRASFDEVVAYEDRYERSLSTRFSVDTLCLYDARRLSGVEAARIIEVHARRVA